MGYHFLILCTVTSSIPGEFHRAVRFVQKSVRISPEVGPGGCILQERKSLLCGGGSPAAPRHSERHGGIRGDLGVRRGGEPRQPNGGRVVGAAVWPVTPAVVSPRIFSFLEPTSDAEKAEAARPLWYWQDPEDPVSPEACYKADFLAQGA